MTNEQFLRWQDFSIRMAENCYPKATETRREKIVEEVKSFFDERTRDYQMFWDWDGNNGSECLTDYVDDFFDEYRHWIRHEEWYGGKFYNQITCCIRAGFDIAVEPSGGVIGFTAGDIRRMYNDEVPSWVKKEWNIPFDTIPDDKGLWL